MRTYQLTLCLFIVFLSFGCGSNDEQPMEPEELPFQFSGKWLGQWSDSLFPFLNVSANNITQLSDGTYSGSFYYNTMGNPNYTPCCGDANDDGVFTFELDGDLVINWEYRQNAPDYRGGCPGTYTGSGELNRNINRLIINFTGTDCDGFHDEGRVTFEYDGE